MLYIIQSILACYFVLGVHGEFKWKQEYENRLEYWMGELPQKLKEVPIIYLAIPGSHNSMTYGMDSGSDPAPDAPEIPSWVLTLFSGAAVGWSKTQYENVTHQLNMGIRYFDLRVATNKKYPGKLFFTHAFYAQEVTLALNSIRDYLDTHPLEVVILDFQHFHQFDGNAHNILIDKLLSTFQTLICEHPREVRHVTISNLNNLKEQVIIVYREHTKRGVYWFWKDYHFQTRWPKTDDTTKLIDILKDQIEDRKMYHNQGFVIQGIITPSKSLISWNFWSSLRGYCGEQVISKVITFIEQYRPGPPPEGQVNIVIADFVDIMSYQFPKSVISLNFKLLQDE